MLIPTIEELIYCKNFLEIQGLQHQIAYMQDKAKVTTNVAHAMSELTKAKEITLCGQARKGRLTASNFRSVLKCKRVTPSLMKHLFGDDLSRLNLFSI